MNSTLNSHWTSPLEVKKKQKQHWSISPFNTISDFGSGQIMLKQKNVEGGAPPSVANQGDKTIWLDKANLTKKIRRQTKNNIWAQITGRTKFPGSTEQVESDYYRG